jgi:hypothetical protein
MRTLSISPAQMFISRASSARPRAVQREEYEVQLSSAILFLLIYLSTEIEVLEKKPCGKRAGVAIWCWTPLRRWHDGLARDSWDGNHHLGPPSLTRTNVLGDVSHVSLLSFARVREDLVLRPLVAGESVGPRFESSTYAQGSPKAGLYPIYSQEAVSLGTPSIQECSSCSLCSSSDRRWLEPLLSSVEHSPR